jgi:murein biosynthesis integral membrane protein MurJ
MEEKHKEQNHIGKKIFRGTLIILVVTVLAKLAAFLSEAVNAAYLGTTYKSDAYYMVASIQQVLYPMLSIGIWKVFLPIYKDKLTHNDQSGADGLANKMISFFTIISISAVVLLILLASPVVSLVAPGFEGETKRLCIELVRISAPMYVFIIAAAIYASMLQCHNKFFGSQIREVATHIPVILAAVLFYRRFGIRAMAIALIAGGLLRLLVELPFVDWGYRFRPDFNFKCPEFGVMLKRLPSALLSEGVHQINVLIDRAMASMFPEGAVSGMNYGHRLTNVFSGLLSSAVATALFPQMVELISRKKLEELEKLMTKILSIFMLLMIPVTIACMLFSEDLVRAVFERGAFQEESVSLTAGVFTFYSLGLLFVACSTVVTNVFYGFGDTKTPLIIGLINMGINILLNVTLAHIMGVNGLALATSLAALISLGLRFFFVRKHVELEWKQLGLTFVKVLLAAAFACGSAWMLSGLLQFNVYLRLILAAAVGVALYLAAVKLLRVREVEDLHRLLRKKLKKS